MSDSQQKAADAKKYTIQLTMAVLILSAATGTICLIQQHLDPDSNYFFLVHFLKTVFPTAAGLCGMGAGQQYQLYKKFKNQKEPQR